VSFFSPSSGAAVRLGEVFGIQVRVHYLWFVMPLLLVPVAQEPLRILVLLLATFGAVFLHELGHSLVAQHFGIRVLDITFWPLGGMARMTEIPENPKVEGLIAVAGPAVNFLLAALSMLAMLAFGLAGLELPAMAAFGFIWINLVLGVFNLVPAFPMDGGRILRAFLARKRDWVTATEMAVKTGRIVAIAMIVLAFVSRSSSFCVIPLIAAFVWFAGGQELLAVRLRHGLSPFRNLFGGDATGAGPSARPGGPGGAWSRARDAMRAGSDGRAERPTGREPDVRPGGFSDADIAEMERYRGRIRPPE
jgi:Zn-dependent protease